MKRFCENLREPVLRIINYEKKKNNIISKRRKKST